MFRPEDLIPDEIEHSEQTRHLQHSYPMSQADQRSLLRIRTRLLAQRSSSFSPDEPPEHPVGGQFLPHSFLQPSRPKRTAVSTWRLVARWRCCVCLCSVASGMRLHVVLFKRVALSSLM